MSIDDDNEVVPVEDTIVPPEVTIVPVEDEDSEVTEETSEEVTPAPVIAKIRLFLESLDTEELSALVEARRRRLGDDAFIVSATSPGNYDYLLSELSGAHSIEADRSRASISSIKDSSLFNTKLVRGGKTILGTMKPHRAAGNGAMLTGADALAALAIRDKWMKRVPLYNSGFSVDIIAPTLSALNTFFNKAHDVTNSYGRQFGGLFFYFHDLMIKEAIVELVLPLIINSTLRNAKRGDTLVRNIKLVDLKLILNAIGALMFPDGFNFTHVCSNPDGSCTHHEEVLIDINKLARYDFSKLTDDCIHHMTRLTDITPTQLNIYQAQLGFNEVEIRYKQYGFTMQMPSLNDYLDYGRSYNSELLSNVFVSNPDAVVRAVMFSYYQIYTPFIAKLILYNEDDSVDFWTLDKDTITHMLLRLQSEDTEGTLIKNFDDFIANSEIGRICYPAVACPACNYVPGSGYYTVDPTLAFFIQSLMKLDQT